MNELEINLQSSKLPTISTNWTTDPTRSTVPNLYKTPTQFVLMSAYSESVQHRFNPGQEGEVPLQTFRCIELFITKSDRNFLFQGMASIIRSLTECIRVISLQIHKWIIVIILILPETYGTDFYVGRLLVTALPLFPLAIVETVYS